MKLFTHRLSPLVSYRLPLPREIDRDFQPSNLMHRPLALAKLLPHPLWLTKTSDLCARLSKVFDHFRELQTQVLAYVVDVCLELVDDERGDRYMCYQVVHVPGRKTSDLLALTSVIIACPKCHTVHRSP